MSSRLNAVQRHLQPLSLSECAASTDPKKVRPRGHAMTSSHEAQAKTGVFRVPVECERFPAHRHEVLKWNGWGYTDSMFYLNEDGA